MFFQSARRRAAAPEFEQHGKAAPDEQHRRGLGNDGGIFNEEVFDLLECPGAPDKRNGCASVNVARPPPVNVPGGNVEVLGGESFPRTGRARSPLPWVRQAAEPQLRR